MVNVGEIFNFIVFYFTEVWAQATRMKDICCVVHYIYENAMADRERERAELEKESLFSATHSSAETVIFEIVKLVSGTEAFLL